MRLQDLNWMDVENYLKHDDRIILVTGATEQHAYLSLFTDILIPSRVADAVAQRLGVLVAPPLNFGVSTIFREFPGTITLSTETFDRVLAEIVESLFHQGFRRFMVLNGHRGNAMPERLRWLNDVEELRLVWYDWWTSPAATQHANKHNLTINHANWGENFPFNRVAESPDEEKPDVDPGALYWSHSPKHVLGDGSFGGPYQVDDQIMLKMFEKVVKEVTEVVESL